MLYLQSKKVNLNASEEFDVGFHIKPNAGFLVGFSDLIYTYSDKKDHHVKEIALEINSSIIGTNKIRVNVNADMIDNGKNQSKTCEDSYITISVFAFSDDELISTDRVTALTAFKVGYGDTDHHLQEYGASVNLKSSYMQDQHDDDRATGTVTGMYIDLPKSIDASALKPDDIKCQAVFISGFAIKKNESDCHVLTTGINVSANYTSISTKCIFKDNHGDQQLSQIGSYARATVLYLTKNGNLAVFIPDKYRRNDDAVKLDDVPNHFENINADGIKEYWPGHLDSGSITTKLGQKSHIQGFASYTNLNIRVFSHSYLSDYGFLIFSYPNSSNYIKIPTCNNTFNHPGGVQSIGDYLLVPCEKCDSNNESYIRLYDMSLLKLNLPPEPCEQFQIHRNSENATAAGITKYEDIYGKWYLLVVLNWGICDFYKAKADKPLPDCEFIHVSRRDMGEIWDPYGKGYDVQCINLVTQSRTEQTDTTEKVYMIAFATKESGGPAGTFEDHAILISICPKVEKEIKPYDCTNEGLDCICFVQDKHIYCKHNEAVGKLGVHFRYGAALEVKDKKLVLYATGRNFSNGKVLCNYFVEDAGNKGDNYDR